MLNKFKSIFIGGCFTVLFAILILFCICNWQCESWSSTDGSCMTLKEFFTGKQ